jgi:drug/metabolite transporter (DMT)-like permease
MCLSWRVNPGALPFTQASVAPLIYACTPALTALYIFFATGTRITQKQVAGIAIGLAGVAIIILYPLLDRVENPAAFRGNAIIFMAAVAFMYYGVLSKQFQMQHKVSPLALTFSFSLVTLLAMIPFTIWEVTTMPGGVSGIVSTVETRHVLAVLAMGILGTGMFYLVYQYAIAAGTELAANLFTYLQPVMTILMAVLFLQEQIGPAFVIGGVLAIIGARIARG